MLSQFTFDFTASQCAAGAAFLVLAGLLRGFSGYGFGVAAVPLLSLIAPPAQVIPVILVLQFLIGANGIRETARICEWRLVLAIAAGAVLMTPLGLWLLSGLSDSVVRLCIAAIVTLSVLILIARTTRVAPPSVWVGMLYGAASGLFNGLAAMPGPPVIAFFLRYTTAKETARASMIILFSLTSVSALVPLLLLHKLSVSSVLTAFGALPIVWISTSAGRRLFLLSSEFVYRWTGVVFLGLTALFAALKGLGIFA